MAQLPITPIPRRMIWRSYEPSFLSEAHNLRQIVNSRGVHRWEIVAEYPPMTRAAAAPLISFLASMRGRFNQFWVIPPVVSAPLGAAAGTPLVRVSASIGATSVSTKGWTPSAVVFRALDLIQFTGHTKAYQVTADVTADGSGFATVPIHPQLYHSVVVDEPIRRTNVGLYGRLTDDLLTWEWGQCSFADGLMMAFVETPTVGVPYPDEANPPDDFVFDINAAGDNLLINAANDRLVWR